MAEYGLLTALINCSIGCSKNLGENSNRNYVSASLSSVKHATNQIIFRAWLVIKDILS